MTDTSRVESARRDPLLLGVAAVAAALPFGDFSVPGAGSSLTYVLMLVPGAIVAVRLITDRVSVPRSFVLLGLALCMVAGLISDVHGIDPATSISFVPISMVTLAYACAVVVAIRPGDEGMMLNILLLVGAVVAAEALSSAGEITAAESGTVVNGRLTGPFAQPNELGIFCAMLLPIAVGAIVTAGSRRMTILLTVAAALVGGAWAMSMSRGAWIGGSVALICLWLIEPAVRRVLGGLAAAVVATGVLAFVLPSSTPILGVLGERMRSLSDPTANPYDARPLIWADALRQAGDHPWFGVGSGGFEVAATNARSSVSSYPVDHAHNLTLTVLAERGVIGIAAGLVLVLACILAARARAATVSNHDDVAARVRSLAVSAALAALLVHCVFDMPLRNPMVAGLVWTLLGLAASSEVAIAREFARSRQRERSRQLLPYNAHGGR